MAAKRGGGPSRGSAGEEFEGILSRMGAGEVPLDESFRDGLETQLRRSYRNSFGARPTALSTARRFSAAFALVIGILIGASIWGPMEDRLGLGTVSAQSVLQKAVRISEKIEAAVLHIKSASAIRDIYSGQTSKAVVEEWVDLSDPLAFCRLIIQPDKASVAQACNGEDTYLYLRTAFQGQPGYLIRMQLSDDEKDRLRARILLRRAQLKTAEPYADRARYIRKETALDNRPVHTITYDMQVVNPWSRERDSNPDRIPANVTMKIDAENYRVLSYVEQAEFNGIWFTTFSREMEQFELMGPNEIDPIKVIEGRMDSEVRLVDIPRSGRSHYQDYMARMALAGLGDYLIQPADLVPENELPGVLRSLDKIIKEPGDGGEPAYAVRLPDSRYRLHFGNEGGQWLTLENRLPYSSLDRSWNAKTEVAGRSWLVETNFGLECDQGSKGVFSRDISFLHPRGEPIYIKGRSLTQEEIAQFIKTAVVPYDEDEARRALQIPWGDPPILEELPDNTTEMPAPRPWRRGTLGMAIAPSDDGRGSTVIAVFEKGPAGRMGVREGDRLLYLNGVPIANNLAFKDELDKRRFGDTVTLTLERDNQLFEVKPTLVRRIYLLDQM